VLIFHGRPDLPHLVREIILGVESGIGLPEDLLVNAEALEESSIMQKGAWQSLPIAARFQALVHRSLVSCGESALRKRIDEHFGALTAATGNTARSAAGTFSAAATHGLVEDFFAPVIEEGVQAFLPPEVPQLMALVVGSCADRVGGSSGGGDSCGGGSVGDSSPPTFGAADLAHICYQMVDAEMLSGRQSRASVAAAEEAKKRMVSTFAAAPKKRRTSTRATELDRESSGITPTSPEEFANRVSSEQLKTWQMLYCGGSKPVVDALAGIQLEFGINLRVEKFDW